MLDDFIVRATLAGIGVALAATPLGCFVVWRRMAYFGDTMAHSALLGIVLSLLLDASPNLGVFFVAALVAGALLLLARRGTLSTDALLGILAHSTLAGGLVLVALTRSIRIDLLGLLFGDILAVSAADLGLIYGGGALVLSGIALLWRSLLADTVSSELAQAEGLHPERARLAFMLLLALVIAIAMKIVGILLITALLVIPAATARRFASSPERMVVIAAAAGVLSVIGGLSGSLHWDTPSGPSIVVAALGVFLASLIVPRLSD